MASAYALVGREDVAQDLISRTALPSWLFRDETFGSDVRDQSIQLMTLCLWIKAEAATLVEELSKTTFFDDWLSTRLRHSLYCLVGLPNKYRVDGAMDFTYAVAERDEPGENG